MPEASRTEAHIENAKSGSNKSSNAKTESLAPKEPSASKTPATTLENKEMVSNTLIFFQTVYRNRHDSFLLSRLKSTKLNQLRAEVQT